ncbi:MAG: PKD domain-containing protein [Candidatus Cloacimonetes bacterium]|nr:PKD domain-containing protein [Candidatus Cloacimonadota bacterium]
MRKIFLITLLFLLTVFACNRFEHNFEPEYIAPVAEIWVDSVQGYAPFEVTFRDSSNAGSKALTSWKWDFDNDGVIDSENQNPIHTFSEVGDFFAKLTISDGETDSSDSLLISVLQAGSPLADFSYDIVTAHAPVDVTFSDLSVQGTFEITTWNWDFDNDGTIDSAEQNPSYVFSEPGNYTIKLTVSDGNLESSFIKNLKIQENSVFVELFTGTWCTYCPIAESALHNLSEENEFGEQLTYVEYHMYDDLGTDNIDIFSYYPNGGSLPITVVNGNARTFDGADVNLENRIKNTVNDVLNAGFEAGITLEAMNLENNTLDIEVSLDLEETVSLNNLKLKYILMEELDDQHQNHDGEYLHNVVYYRNDIDISAYNGETIEFSITDLDEFPPEVSEDLILVIWIQTVEEVFNTNTCNVYNVLTKAIN